MSYKPTTPANLLYWTFRFWFNHIGVITFLMLVAAVGRAMQLKALGPIPSAVNFWLEVMVELARLLTLAAIIGHGYIMHGFRRMGALLAMKREEWRKIGRTLLTTLRKEWMALLAYLVIWGLIALVINKSNGLIADHVAVLTFLKQNGILHETATGMPLFFFLKNLTIIPLTLVFEYGLIRWGIKQRQELPINA